MIRSIVISALALALALIPGAAFAGAGSTQTCEHLIMTGDTVDVTTITSTTAEVATYLSANSDELFDRTGEWADGTTDELEFCWTPGNSRDQGVFLVSFTGGILSDKATSGTIISIGTDTTTGIAAGDELAHSTVTVEATLAIEQESFAVRGVTGTLSTGACIGLIVDSDTSGAAISVVNWVLEIKQLTDQDGSACQS